MSMREVRVYDGDFPTMDQVLSGDPAARFPKEIWQAQLRPGEFAVRYKDFKTGLARNPWGARVQSSEICRIFTSLQEARLDSNNVSSEHWTVRCFIYDHTGREVATVANNKEVGKFAVAMYAGVLLWVGFFAIVGMGFIWIVSLIAKLTLKSSLFELPPGGWIGWLVYVFAGLLLGILAWYLRLQFIAKRHVSTLRHRLDSTLSAKEKSRFEELNTLFGSSDPAARQRFLELAAEYRAKIREALK